MSQNSHKCFRCFCCKPSSLDEVESAKSRYASKGFLSPTCEHVGFYDKIDKL